MKKSLLFIGALLAVGIASYAIYKSTQDEITNFPSANSGIVAFGDSLTYGKGSTQGGGFVKQIG